MVLFRAASLFVKILLSFIAMMTVLLLAIAIFSPIWIPRAQNLIKDQINSKLPKGYEVQEIQLSQDWSSTFRQKQLPLTVSLKTPLGQMETQLRIKVLSSFLVGLGFSAKVALPNPPHSLSVEGDMDALHLARLSQSGLETIRVMARIQHFEGESEKHKFDTEVLFQPKICKAKIRVPEFPVQYASSGAEAQFQISGKLSATHNLTFNCENPTAFEILNQIQLKELFFDSESLKIMMGRLNLKTLTGSAGTEATASLLTSPSSGSSQEASVQTGSFTISDRGGVELKDLEMVVGETYLSPNLNAAQFEHELKWDLSEGLNGLDLKSSARVGAATEIKINLTKLSQFSANAKFDLRDLSTTLPEFFPAFLSKDSSGKLLAEAQGRISPDVQFQYKIDSIFKLKGPDFEAGSATLPLFQLRTLARSMGSFQAGLLKDKTDIKTLEGNLLRLPLQLQQDKKSAIRFSTMFQIQSGSLNWTLPSETELTLGRAKPLKIGLGPGDLALESLKGAQGTLGLRLDAPYADTQTLVQEACVRDGVIPPSLALNMIPQSFELEGQKLLMNGSFEASVFQGTLLVQAIEMTLDPFSPWPTVRFYLTATDIDLSSLGRFSQFGGMVGRLDIHLQEFLFQNGYVENYDLEFRLLEPAKGGQIEFSEEATQNLIRIFAQGQGIQSSLLIKLAGQFFGSYGIDYGGFHAKTEANHVVVSTFDPEFVVDREGARYFLYGNRIKMPIESPQYPVVLSRQGWTGFLKYLFDQYQNLSTQPTAEGGDSTRPDSIFDCPVYADGEKPNGQSAREGKRFDQIALPLIR